PGQARPRRRVAVDWRDAGRRWYINREHSEKVALGGENLNATVRPVAHIDVVVAIDGNRVWKIELPRSRAASAPGFHPIAILVVLRDAGIDVAIGDVDVPFRIPRHVGRLAEKPVHRRQGRIDVLPWFAVLVGRFLPASEDHLHTA